MLESGIPTILLWAVVGWLLAIGLFMALLYASGERDHRTNSHA